MKLLLKNGYIKKQKQHLLITDDKIAYIGKNIPDCDREIDVEGLDVIPGMIDPHVHVRDLKQSEKEDWTSASQAALRGGICTIFDMPNTNPPTLDLPSLLLKREKAKKASVNYKFNVAATSCNLPQLTELLNNKPEDVAALKLFMAGSNSNEFVEDPETLDRIFTLSRNYNLPLIVHSESQKCVNEYAQKIKTPEIKDHNYIRNRKCAEKSTGVLIDLANRHGNKLYIAHTSTAEEIDLLQEAKKKNPNIYCETSPHHLLLNEEILTTAGNFGKVNPPLRTSRDNQRILQGILDYTVDTIGTDHAPHLKTQKERPYAEAPSGFPSLELAMPLLLNQVNEKKITLERLIELTSLRTSEIFNLPQRGKLEEGFFADIAVIDRHKKWTIHAKNFRTKAKYSPYENFTGIGDVVMTFVNGKLLYSRKADEKE
ncbi:MAG: hypothetical protein CSB06_02545 [Bacteroidia bacterium]|nr:MAG: hypothetical protein CSB06_02545 [Bacteroidia bacterium]